MCASTSLARLLADAIAVIPLGPDQTCDEIDSCWHRKPFRLLLSQAVANVEIRKCGLVPLWWNLVAGVANGKITVALDGVEFVRRGEILTRAPILSPSLLLFIAWQSNYWFKFVERSNKFFLQTWTSACVKEQVKHFRILFKNKKK